jgi:ADA HAT complex component 1
MILICPPAREDSTSLSPLQQKIESHFCLEILLKHQELRLIEQELAKCQAALEQLRRCQLIPYPSSTSSPIGMVNVSNGTGPALFPGVGEKIPESPAPWGVTDGPYTKHYAKWLIPDARFDGVTDEDTIAVAGKGIFEGRATRGSLTDSATPLATKSRPQRGSAGAKLQALSSGYPTAREKAGPLIIKRSDGQYVKLVCLDCERGDFSSAQGFINHCRIAHHKSFESHDAAAMACGQVIDGDGAASGSSDGPANGVTCLVHPLIRAAPTTPTPAVSGNPSWIKGSASGGPGGQTATLTGFSKNNISRRRPPLGPTNQTTTAEPQKESGAPDFVPSLQTPHLSALMKKKGFGGNLGEMVGEAAKKVELNMYSSTEDEECCKENITTDSATKDGQQRKRRRPFGGYDGACDEDESYVVGGRMPARAGMSPNRIMLGRPGSSKGLDKAGRKPGSSLYTGTAPHSSYQPAHIGLSSSTSAAKHQEDEGVVILDHPQAAIDLSPHTSSASESLPNAPSLVSDDGDYAANSSDDSESPCSVADADDEEDVMDFGVEVGDYGDETTGCGSEATTTDADLTPLGGKGTPLGGRVNHTPGTKQNGVRKVKDVRRSRK